MWTGPRDKRNSVSLGQTGNVRQQRMVFWFERINPEHHSRTDLLQLFVNFALGPILRGEHSGKLIFAEVDHGYLDLLSDVTDQKIKSAPSRLEGLKIAVVKDRLQTRRQLGFGQSHQLRLLRVSAGHIWSHDLPDQAVGQSGRR